MRGTLVQQKWDLPACAAVWMELLLMDLVKLSEQCTPLHEYSCFGSIDLAFIRLLPQPALPVPNCMIDLTDSVPCVMMPSRR